MPDEQTSSQGGEKETTPVVDDQVESSKLDESVSERTAKNFEILQEKRRQQELEIDRLKRENDELKKSKSIDPKIPDFPQLEFDKDNYPNLTQNEIDTMIDKVITPDGYVNESELKKQLKDANRKAQLAEEAAKAALAEAKATKADAERERQEKAIKKAFKKYPTLNPEKADYDERFYNLVRNEMAAQRAQFGEADLLKACKDISEVYTPPMTKKEKEKKETDIAKETINAATPTNQRKETMTNADRDNLSHRMRTGSLRDQRNALAERLAKAK